MKPSSDIQRRDHARAARTTSGVASTADCAQPAARRRAGCDRTSSGAAMLTTASEADQAGLIEQGPDARGGESRRPQTSALGSSPPSSECGGRRRGSPSEPERGSSFGQHPEVGDQSDKREAFITEVLPSVQGQLLVRAKETPCARLAGAHHERKPREVRANVTNDGAPVFAIDRGEITAGSTPPKAKTAIAAAPRMHDQILRANVLRNPTTDGAARYRL